MVALALAEALARPGTRMSAASCLALRTDRGWQTRLCLLGAAGGDVTLEGRLDSLLEEFQTRRRAKSRQSAAPWMALAEIHRAVGNEEERRGCLYEASRMRPKDLALLTETFRRCEEKAV